MSAIGNVLWFIFGGFFMGLGWWVAGLLCAITIVAIPWAKACFVIVQFAFLPFGKEAVNRAELSGREDIGFLKRHFCDSSATVPGPLHSAILGVCVLH